MREHLGRYGGHRAAAGLSIDAGAIEGFRAAFEAHAAAVLTADLLEPVERVDAVVSGSELGLELAEELEALEPCGLGNPGPRLFVPGARFGDVRTMGEGRHARFTVTSGGARARAVAFGCDGRVADDLEQPQDATFRLERNAYNGAVEARLVLRQAQPCAPAPIALLEPRGDYLSAVLAELEAGIGGAVTGAEPLSRRTIVDRRGHSPLAVLADAVATGEPVLAVCADVPRRLPGLRERVGGFALTSYGELERRPARAAGHRRVVALDPPADEGAAALLRAGEGVTLLAWGPAELRFAEQIHELEYGLRASLVAFYRALRARERAAGEELERLLRGDGSHGRSARLAGRLIRVLAELELVSLDPELPALAIAGRAPTTLERSPSFRVYAQRYEDGKRYLSSANPPAKRLSRAMGRGGVERNGADAPIDAVRRSPEGDGSGTVGAPTAVAAERPAVDQVADPGAHPKALGEDLSPLQQGLLGDLFAIVEEHADQAARPIERDRVEAAFVYASIHHEGQRRLSGEEFIAHPVSVAKICAGMRLDTETLCAALLHDTVEDTSASLEELRSRFGDEVTGLVDGVTKLTGLTFQSRDEAQAENYRKMVVAMASDIRVILIKLADRLHNMRTISAMSKQKQIEKSRETLDIYAPIAHRLGIHAIKWELEDLAFQTLHPRKFNEIKGLVAQQREERERYVEEAGDVVASQLNELGIHADISGRAKHFYSIYSKMTKKGREFNEIYDLTAMRVIVDSVKDTYGAVGVIHSLWKPLPGRFKDFIAMPKFNMYQSLHTTVIGPEGRPLEIQIRTRDMHDLAEFGIAAHWMYKSGSGDGGTGPRDPDAKLKWLRSLMDWQQDMSDSAGVHGEPQGRPVRG